MKLFPLGVALLLPASLLLAALPASAQHRHPAVRTAPASAHVVMLSDIHFDPYVDPGKFARLRSADVAAWAGILAEPATVGRDAAWEALHTACGPRGSDSDFHLLSESLRAAHEREPRPAFVTVSGDLMAHEFDCRFHKLAPDATAADYSAFAAKTTAFVAAEVRARWPRTPVYFALGNNDSGCGDYKESPGSAYLGEVADAFAAGASDQRSRAAVRTGVAASGDYSVALPRPFRRARIVVLQDIFEARRAAGCAAQSNADVAAAQVKFLRETLAAARAAHEHVWVVAHIPPGVDVYSTVHPYLLRGATELCAKGKPAVFLGDEAMVDALTDFADVVSLAVFAHSHEDELRLLTRGDRHVAAKLVPSISPVNGNAASFTVATVRTTDAVMEDYAVVTATGPLLAPDGWGMTYSFRATYDAPAFDARSLGELTASMATHKPGTADAGPALTYQRWFFPGDKGLTAAGLDMFWPAYSCSLTEDRAAEYWKCACPVVAPEPQ